MIDITKIDSLKKAIKPDLDAFLNATDNIKSILNPFADKKNLKGSELTGWLGEVYAKTLYGGTLVDDKHEHDFVTATGERYAVKARKGKNNGWEQTSAISKIEGEDCPHFLLFIHFNDKYEIEHIWRYDWKWIFDEKRFIPKAVRGEGNRWYFKVSPKEDVEHLVYSLNESGE